MQFCHNCNVPYDPEDQRQLALHLTRERSHSPVETQNLREEWHCWLVFKQALDTRLLNYATEPGRGAALVSLVEYERWLSTGKVAHLSDCSIIQDAVAASFQDGYRGYSCDDRFALYNEVRIRIGLGKIVDSD